MAKNIEITVKKEDGSYEKLIPSVTAKDNSCYLTEETAQNYDLSASATPSDVFLKLSKIVNFHIWTKQQVLDHPIIDLGSVKNIIMFDNGNMSVGNTRTFNYGDNVSYEKGSFDVYPKRSVDIKQNYSDTEIKSAKVLYGKYVKVNNIVYFFEPDCVVTGGYVSDSSTPVYASKVREVFNVSSYGDVEFVSSSNKNKYPVNGIVGEYKYNYLRVLADGVRTYESHYIGTGTAGRDNPNILEFPFLPRIVVINIEGQNSLRYICGVLFVPQSNTLRSSGISIWPSSSSNIGTVVVNATGTTVSWYSNGNSEWQMNGLSTRYNIWAIG